MIQSIFLLLIHWYADFVCQTDEQAKNKSTSWAALLEHTATYSVIWLFPIFLVSNLITAVMFCAITFVAHTFTDYITSRINSRLWKEGKVHDFFVSIGFDQWLHAVQIILTFYFLIHK